jgi:hypothetical protein
MCPSCGYENRAPGRRWCKQCREPLTADAQPVPPAALVPSTISTNHHSSPGSIEIRSPEQALEVLRNGSESEKIQAREQLAVIFEQRGMYVEATDLVVSNVRAGVKNADIFRWLARLYRAQGDEVTAMQAAAEATKYMTAPGTLSPRIEPPAPYSDRTVQVPALTERVERRPMSPSVPADPDRRLLAEVQQLLTPNERVLGFATQSRVALSMRKDAVVATTNRLIFYRPSILGARNFRDYRWEDIVDVRLHDGMLSSEIRLTAANRAMDGLGSLDKEQARRVYVVCQQKEMEWREKRRIRQMEHDRARAGGVSIVNGQQGGASEDPMEKLARAKAMLDQGLISEAEYETIKARVISSF